MILNKFTKKKWLQKDILWEKENVFTRPFDTCLHTLQTRYEYYQ